MVPYVDAGLFEDVSDIWEEPDVRRAGVHQRCDDHRRQAVGRALHILPVGRLLPQRHLSTQLGLSEPTNWEEEKANCQTYLDNGIKCYTIGTKFLWTAGGWFDYLNMRTNGYDFHVALASGEAEWTDAA